MEPFVDSEFYEILVNFSEIYLTMHTKKLTLFTWVRLTKFCDFIA